MSPNKKNIILVIVAALLLGVLGFLLVRTFGARQVPATSAPTSVQAQHQAALKAQATTIAALEKIKLDDTDMDGLTNAEEKTYGTDPNKPDTDGDGLLDRDEVKVYKTNPLKYDTYGLGHSDGWGVRHHKILPGGKFIK